MKSKIKNQLVFSPLTANSLQPARTCRFGTGGLKASSGFSIVETIVAIAILSIALVAPLSLAQKSLNSSTFARNQVTAFYLAQEAIEYVRYVRDTNSLKGLSQGAIWLNGLGDCINPKLCGVDVNLPQVVECTVGSSDCQMVFNSQTGIYGLFASHQSSGIVQSPWQVSQFTRTLNIKPANIGSDVNAEADLVAEVSWYEGSAPKKITIKEKIFDWLPAPVI